MEKRILLTAFRGTSSQRLLEGVTAYKTLLLPNHKTRDSEIVAGLIAREHFDCIISTGQKPNIKNKVHIETTARDGQSFMLTDFDCAGLVDQFEKAGLHAELSKNAGTSYCNQLYLNTMGHISRNGIHSQVVFVHIPYEKNVSDFEDFRRRFMAAIEQMREGLA